MNRAAQANSLLVEVTAINYEVILALANQEMSRQLVCARSGEHLIG